MHNDTLPITHSFVSISNCQIQLHYVSSILKVMNAYVTKKVDYLTCEIIGFFYAIT